MEHESQPMRILIASHRAGAHLSERMPDHHLRTLSDQNVTCHEAALMANYPHPHPAHTRLGEKLNGTPGLGIHTLSFTLLPYQQR